MYSKGRENQHDRLHPSPNVKKTILSWHNGKITSRRGLSSMQRPLFIFSFFLVHPSISSLTLGQQWTVMHFKDFLLGLEAFLRVVQ